MMKMRPLLVSTFLISSLLCFAATQEQQGAAGNEQQPASTPSQTTEPSPAPPSQTMPQSAPETAAPSKMPPSPAKKWKGRGDQGQGGWQKGQCKKEFEAACPGMHPGDGKFGPCVKENMDKLSDRCQRAVRHMMMRGRMKHKHAEEQGEGAEGGGYQKKQDPDENQGNGEPSDQSGADNQGEPKIN